MVSQRAREILAAEYEASTPGSEMAELVLSGVPLERRGIHMSCLRAIDKAYDAGGVDERARIVAWLLAKKLAMVSPIATARAIEQGEHSPEAAAEGVKGV